MGEKFLQIKQLQLKMNCAYFSVPKLRQEIHSDPCSEQIWKDEKSRYMCKARIDENQTDLNGQFSSEFIHRLAGAVVFVTQFDSLDT